MQPTNNITEELTQLFNDRQFQKILEISTKNEINPSNEPNEAYIVAASLFQISKYDECLLVRKFSTSHRGDASFASMYGAVYEDGKCDAKHVFEGITSIHRTIFKKQLCKPFDRSERI